MRRFTMVLFLLGSVPAFGAKHHDPCAQPDAVFTPGCTIPYASIATDQDLDSTCPTEGCVDKSEKRRLASLQKNNLCATNTPIAVTFSIFDRLQAAAEKKGIPTGSPNSFPDDRDDLTGLITVKGTKLGEGQVVMLAAWVMKAHYSNTTTGGENVNCFHDGDESNDIHVALTKNKNDAECTSVTAEIIPHFRPDDWSDTNLVNLQFPVRMTGQLFYDSIHKPCENGDGKAPRRRASWEIHPVYRIDVCSKKALAQCDPTNDSLWTPLNEFLTTHPPDEDTEEP